ncbi:recombinase family protein, partial [Sulfuricurvum sp.]|uniref:recombinase family protein n=1 Tax=Sulfuricurvum sp. TaxID=2025608 RepID=UPI003BB63881
LLLSVMGAFAEFERSWNKERQREGIELAKKRGAYKGRKPALSSEQILKIKELDKTGVAKSKIAREFNVTRQTIYSVL